MRARGRRGAVGALAAAAALLAIAGCNLVLGIEEQPLRPSAEDAGPEVVRAQRPAFEACAHDIDCVAPNGCYTPHCDAVLGACTYALCEAKDRACAKGTCDLATFTCSAPQPYGFASTSYPVTAATSGCGQRPEACVAAIFPFLFLGGRDRVVALRADDLTDTEARSVTLEGLTVKPQQVIASGRRLWVLGSVQGTAPSYRLPIAVLDVPSDPTVTVLVARAVLVSYPFAVAEGFPAPDGGLFVAVNDPAQGFPTARLLGLPNADATFGTRHAPDAGAGGLDAGPLVDVPGSVTMYRVGGALPGGSLVASSGARIVVHRSPSTLNLLDAAGTESGALSPDLGLGPPLVSLGPATFAEGPDGALAVAAAIAADPTGSCACTSRARLGFVLANGGATAASGAQLLDLATYTNPQAPSAACHVCAADYVRARPLATWLDARSALTAVPFADARTTTDVRLAARDPLDANPRRRAQIPRGDFSVDRVALASAGGVGYLVRADGQGNDVSVTLFDPRCDAP
jgi:hypothetical protein